MAWVYDMLICCLGLWWEELWLSTERAMYSWRPNLGNTRPFTNERIYQRGQTEKDAFIH